MNGDEYIADLLVMRGVVEEAQVEEARNKVAENGKKSVLDGLKDLNHVSEDDILLTLSAEYGMDTFDLENYDIPQEAVDAMPAEVARRYEAVPVMYNGNQLVVALADPTDLEALDSLRYVLKQDVEGVIAPRQQVHKSISLHYGSNEETVDSFLQEVTEGTLDVSMPTGESVENVYAEEDEDDENAPIVRLVSLIIMEAFRTRASDIHLEPLEKRFRVRYRVDGVLHEVESPPKYLQNNILSRLKIMSKMDISEHRIPQDGRIRMSTMGRDLDLRVNCIPTSHGESIVMRILDKSGIQLGIPELGFFGDDQQLIDRIIHLPDGVFLVTGPTGSGKTTSLYAFLNTLNEPINKIITAENPVEYELAGVNQVEVNAEIGLTFAAVLRAMLRQAPNIILVGEIRDTETADIAINAALSGHLVFSTLHTNDAPGAVTRLIEMGVKPFLVASGVRAVMAQRLLRRVCKSCAVPVTPNTEDLDFLNLPHDYFEGTDLRQGQGCGDCSEGYRGRVGIFEIFRVTEEIQHLIYEQATTGEVRNKARELGMRSLREDALRKAASGLSTLEEVIRITVSDED